MAWGADFRLGPFHVLIIQRAHVNTAQVCFTTVLLSEHGLGADLVLVRV